MATSTSAVRDVGILDANRNINHLPESVLLKIFSYVPSVTDRCQVARVCSLWKRIILDPFLWEGISWAFQHSKTVDLDSLMEVGFSEVITSLYVLYSLSDREGKYLVQNHSGLFVHAWELFPNLLHLSVDVKQEMFLSDESILRTLPQKLKHLDVSVIPSVNKDACLFAHKENPHPMKDCESNFSNLESLTIYASYLQVEKGNEAIMKGACLWHKTLNESFILPILCSAPNLCCLEMETYTFNSKDWALVARHCAQLKTLALIECPIHGEELEILFCAENLPNLESLEFSFFDGVEDATDTVPLLYNLPKLRLLELRRCWALTESHVRALVHSIPSLTELKLSRSRYINGQVLTRISNLKEGLRCELTV